MAEAQTVFETVLRIPTKEDYAFIEVKITGTKEQIVRAQLEISDYYWKKRDQWEKDNPPF